MSQTNGILGKKNKNWLLAIIIIVFVYFYISFSIEYFESNKRAKIQKLMEKHKT